MGSDRAEWARLYRKAGWALCATRPENNKQPKGLSWQKQSREPNHWDRNPADGIGIIHGLSGTCSIDLDDLRNARLALEAVGIDSVTLDKLLQTGVQIVSGRDNRVKLLYRAPTDLPATRHALNWPDQDTGNDECILELRAGPVHDVLPPSTHPDTGQSYTWRGDWQALPELPDVFAALWHHWELAKANMLDACPWRQVEDAEERIPPGVTLAYNPNGKHNDVIGKFNAAHDINEILHQHGYRRAGRRWLAPGSSTGIPGVVRLPDTEPPRIYSFHGSDPLADGHAHDAFSVVCQLDHRGNLGAAVAKVAHDMGLEMPIDEKAAQIAERIMRGRKNSDNVISINSDSIPPLPPEPRVIVTAPDPGAIPCATLREVRDYIASMTRSHKRDAVTMATIAFACHMSARRYTTPNGQPTAIFCGVTDTSVAGMRRIKPTLYQLVAAMGTQERRSVRGTHLTSASSIYTHLSQCARMLWVTDDFGHAVANHRRQTSGALNSMLNLLLETHSGYTIYMDQDTTNATAKAKNLNECDIRHPAVTVLAMLTDDQLTSMAARGEYGRGTLQQMIVIPAGEMEQASDDTMEVPATTRAFVDRMRAKPGIADNDMPYLQPHTVRVEIDKDAKNAITCRAAQWRKYLSSEERRSWRGVVYGHQQTAERIASALAAWANPETPRINVTIMRWSLDWVERCLMLSMPSIEISTPSGDPDVMQRVMEVLIRNDEYMSDRELQKSCSEFARLNSADRQGLLNQLEEDGLVFCRAVKGTRGPATRKWIAKTQIKR